MAAEVKSNSLNPNFGFTNSDQISNQFETDIKTTNVFELLINELVSLNNEKKEVYPKWQELFGYLKQITENDRLTTNDIDGEGTWKFLVKNGFNYQDLTKYFHDITPQVYNNVIAGCLQDVVTEENCFKACQLLNGRSSDCKLDLSAELAAKLTKLLAESVDDSTEFSKYLNMFTVKDGESTTVWQRLGIIKVLLSRFFVNILFRNIISRII